MAAVAHDHVVGRTVGQQPGQVGRVVLPVGIHHHDGLPTRGPDPRFQRRALAAIDDVGDDATVYLGSDHGFGPIEKFLCFNVWLINEGLLVLKRDAMTLFKRAVFRLGLTPDLAYRSAMKMGLAHLRLSVGVTNRSKLMKLAKVVHHKGTD